MYVEELRRQERAKVRLAIAMPLLGAACLAFLFWLQDFPDNWPLWLMLTAAFVYLSMRSVEVNDRLLGSPTVMVVMTSAVIFGPEHAALACALMAALGPLQPEDIKEKRWFQPSVNFGQMVVSAGVAALALSPFLPESLTPNPSIATLGWIALGSAIAAVVYGAVNLVFVTFIVGRVYGTRHVLPWSHMWQLQIPYLGMGFLGGLLGAAYLLIGSAALPLIAIVFFVGYMTFESYARLREAQESTLRGFIKALEAKDLYTRGHTERVAKFALMIGREMGFSGTDLERLRWAALIHDVGKLAVPRELIRKRARLSDDEYSVMQDHVHHVEELLNEVEFLQPMVEVASNHHAHYDGTGYHGPSHQHGTQPEKEACILAVADSFDAMTSTRSYRVALSQEYAFDELRRHAGTQFDPEVVESFIVALEKSGERYGSPVEISEEEARRRAEHGVAEIREADQVHGRNFPVAYLPSEGGRRG